MTYSMEALGWTLVHFCWQATVIALLYWVVDLATAKARSNVRYGLAVVALSSMLAVSVVTLGYEELRIAREAPALRATPASTHEDQAAIASPVTGAATAAPALNMQIEPSAYVARLLPWLDAAWLIGVLALSLRTVGGWLLIQRLRRTGLIKVPETVRSSFARLSARLGIERSIALHVSELIASPFTMGVFRSVILLPASALTALSVEQLEVVLAHELAHIRRADYLWNMLQTAIETLFFFHPAVWWVSRSIRRQRELCCDDIALAYCSDPIIYATALLSLEEQRSSRLRLAMALDGHQSGAGLRTRIVRILGEAPQDRRESAPLSLLWVCGLLSLFLLPMPRVFASLQASANDAKPTMPAAVVAASSPAPKATARVAPAIASAASAPAAAVAPAIASAASATAAPAAVVAAAPKTRAVVAATLPRAAELQAPPSSANNATDPSSPKSDYISEMRAAGYNVDLDKYIAMKIQGITPQYAQSMASVGFGKPTADELISLKIFGITPDSLKELRATGIEPTGFQDLISYRIFKVTPEFVSGMAAAGFTSIPPKKLMALRIQGVTPEFARTTKQQFPDVTIDQLVQLRIFHIDEAFIAAAKSHGFDRLSIDKLVKLRMSGLLDDGNQRSEKK